MWHISSKNGILKMDRLKIITYSRIHITLVGMSAEGYRRNGGIGFSINKPSMTCVFNPSENFEIFDNRTIPLNKKELSKLIIHLKSLRKKYKCEKVFTCVIEGSIIPHCGFGSSTMLYLSVTEALLRLNGIKYDREQLVRDSGRGGTSGIGINTYFEGGFICDIGIKNIDEILHCADGIMVARGDMGVEIPYEMLPYTQKKLITTCRMLGKRVITATEIFIVRCVIFATPPASTLCTLQITHCGTFCRFHI